jgi:amino acid adenylation domain-containing protein
MESDDIMDQEAYLFPPPCGKFAADAICAQRNLSTSASLAITEYMRATGFSLECLVAAAWSHLFSLYSQNEYVALSTVPGDADGFSPTAARVPAAFNGSVQEWLTAVAESLQQRSPAEDDSSPASASARRGAAGLIASANSILCVGHSGLRESPDFESESALFIHAAEDAAITLSLTGRAGRFNSEIIDMLVDCLAWLLVQLPQMNSKPVSHLVLVSDQMRARYLAGREDVRRISPACCVLKAIEEQCRRNPAKIAAIFNDEQITFGELDQRSTQLGRHLKRLGVGPNVPVAAHFGRSIDILIALLGIVKSGAAFVPLDSSLPAARVESIMQNAGIRIAIASSRLASRFDHGNIHVVSLDAEDAEWKRESAEPFEADIRMEHLAYVIYTSGSTGAPKGVMVEHGHLAAFFTALDEVLGNAPGVWLAVAGVSFDISVTDSLWTLSRGFKIVLHEGDEGLPLLTGRQSALAQIIRHGVTHLHGTPTLMRMLVQDPAAPSALARIQKMLLGGEPFPPDLASELARSIPGEVMNGYGPTETTICATWHAIRSVGTTIPIGRPLLNTTVYVLDKWGRRLPPLAPGELFIGGQSVARGYLGRPDLTAERFLSNSFDEGAGGRLYRTGDLVYFNLDGTLDFIDRLDSQVKIRGYRIELGEIESALQQHAQVGHSVVVVRDEPSGGKSLIAYYTALSGANPQPADLRAYLQGTLPGYMVPPRIVPIDSFPVTPNGKIDRKLLATLEPGGSGQPCTGAISQEEQAFTRSSPADAELTNLESVLCSWCREILGLHTVTPSDDFFEIGGHSLAAVQLMHRVAEEYGTQLKLSVLLHARSMHALARQVHRPLSEEAAWTPVVPLQTAGADTPVFLIAGLGGNILNFEPVSYAFEGRPVYGVETHGLNKNGQVLTGVEEMAQAYLEEIQRIQPDGPYHIAGYSFGGILAFEMAQQLRRSGHAVGLLGLIDTVEWHYSQNVLASMPFTDRLDFLYGSTVKQLLFGPHRGQTLIRRVNASLDHYRLSISRSFGRKPKPSEATTEHRNYYAMTRYQPQPYDGELHLFRCPDQSRRRGSDPLLGWGPLSKQVSVVEIPGKHETVLSEPFVHTFSAELRSTLTAVEQQKETSHSWELGKNRGGDRSLTAQAGFDFFPAH